MTKPFSKMSTIRNLCKKLAGIVTLLCLSRNVMHAQSNSLESLVSGENQFALDLYAQLKSADGNLFFSPYSISTCLGMTYIGARGATAKEMARTFHFDAGPEEIATPMGEMEKQLNDAGKGIVLNTANGLWAQEKHPFLPSFSQAVQNNLSASIKQVDFRTQYEPVRHEINDWVSEKTKNKINDLIGPGMLNPETLLVLVNAIYFKGGWQHPFEKTNTVDAPFTLESGEKVQAKMMHLQESFQYSETQDLQLLEMRYSSGETNRSSPAAHRAPLSMIVLLPKKTNGLKQLEKELSKDALREWLTAAHRQRVKVFFPKFKMTSEFRLARTLSAMGMRDAFSSQADFSGMDGGRDLFISEVVHKAYVDVNEEGTEAAAATGTIMLGMAAPKPQPIPVFRADHPFIFLIRENTSNGILFFGRVNDPTK